MKCFIKIIYLLTIRFEYLFNVFIIIKNLEKKKEVTYDVTEYNKSDDIFENVNYITLLFKLKKSVTFCQKSTNEDLQVDLS